MTIVADVLPDVVKTMGRRSSDSFQRYRCSLGEITLNHTSAKAYKVIPSDLGVSLLRTILHSPWSFVRLFVHPSQVTICNGKYIFFIYSFLLNLNSYDLSLSAVIIMIIRWRLPYGMSIVTKITFIYNNRLTFWAR